MWVSELRCGAAALALCAALQLTTGPAAAAAAPAARAHYKRAEMSAVPFVLGSRYGRSPQHAMQPRTERFFMGGRYGKRSEPPDASAAAELPDLFADSDSTEWREAALTCSFTGVPQLYRCRTAPDPLWDFRHRRSGEVVSEEQ